MKKIYFVLMLISFISSGLLYIGCKDNTIGPLLIRVTDGAYILSEGTNPTNSKLSFYSVSKDSMYQSIYSGTLALPDGLIKTGSTLYLSEQGPNFAGPGKVYKLDSNGTLLSSSQPFGSSPYQLTIANNKIYVTNGPASNVSVLDINSFAVIKTIPVGVYPQEILAVGNKVFVCNTSLFTGPYDSTISVIDAAIDSVVGTITLRKDPASVIDRGTNDFIYAGCQGGGGMIYQININTYTKVDSFNISQGFDKDMSLYGGFIYFIGADNNIDKLDLTSRTTSIAVTNPAPGASYFYGYSFDIVSGKHFVLDANNFSSNGRLYIYNNSGILEKTFTTGVGPRRVVFKYGTGYGGG
jgi:YVTN family beta-propeller protein